MIFKLLLISISLWADYCPEYINENEQALKTHIFLTKVDQNQRFKNCEVEIILCENSTDFYGLESEPIAQIYILDSSNREAYLSVTFNNNRSSGYVNSLVNERTFYYEKKDINYEAEFGPNETFRFELRKKYGSESDIERVELGLYATYTQLNQTNGNDSHWFVCE